MLFAPVDVAAINSWFTPFHYFVYLGTILVIMVVYYQWKWAKICKNNVQILVAQQGGGGSFELAPKEGGSVTLKQGETTRTWMINELATIDVLYPGVGFIPSFMQKTIRMAIVNEGDWEPMLNRSPHRENIASPDVVDFLNRLANGNPNLADEIRRVAGRLATGPTRELIADPASLGSLMSSSVMNALATVSSDLMDVLKSVNDKLSKKVNLNPTIVYVGLGLIIVLLAVVVYLNYSGGPNKEILDGINAIKQSLGIPLEPVVPKP